MGVLVAVFSVALLAAVNSQDLEESFTILIDLNDFHVTQADNHKFLTGDSIGEHDNVVLHLTEDQVRHHMDTHETHDCEHPSELHEVVSFIQENMFEEPASATTFIDQAIGANYNTDLWSQLARPPQPNGGLPFGGLFSPQVMQKIPQTNPAAQPASVPSSPSSASPSPASSSPSSPSSPSAPSSPSSSSPSAAAPSSSGASVPPVATAAAAPGPSSPQPQGPTSGQAEGKTDADEEEAVSRFRDAYRAYKMFGSSAGATTEGTNKGTQQMGNGKQTSQPSSLFDALMDDEDKHLLDMFANHNTYADQATGKNSNFLDKIVEEALSNAADTAHMDVPSVPLSKGGETGNGNGVFPINPTFPSESQKETHHHHHHHHRQEESKEPPSPSSLDLTEDEKRALKSFAQSLLTPEKQKPATGAASLEAIPTMTSHIEKVPKPADFVPESVYQQQPVDFTEKVQPLKHVPKRILIPRMEEPGPVIGGGSRPVHIQLPPPDYDAPLPANTRPSAPSQLSLDMSSSITSTHENDAATTAATTTSTTTGTSNGASTTTGTTTTPNTSGTVVAIGTSPLVTNKNEPSVKPTSLAQSNDEALTEPEVVIFQQIQ